MEINVNELSGSALDWAVAKAVGAYAAVNGSSEIWGCKIWCVPGFENMRWDDWTPSTDWAQGGPLTDRFRPDLETGNDDKLLALLHNDIDDKHPLIMCQGETYLIALCRVIVADRMGSVVNVPDELL